MVAVAEIIREQFEVQSGGILSTGGQALGYNVIDTRYEPTDPRHIVRTFDNAQAAQNYNNEINARLRSNPNFDPRAPSTPAPLRADPNDRIGGSPRPSSPTSLPAGTQPVPMSDIRDINDPRLVGNNDITNVERRQLRSDGRFVRGNLVYTQADLDAGDRIISTNMARLQRQNSLAQMNSNNPQVQARNNLRILSSQMGRRILTRTVIPTNFSPMANIAAFLSFQDAITALNKKLIPGFAEYDESYTWEMYNRDTTRLMGAYYIGTFVPLVIEALRVGNRVFIRPLMTPFRLAVDAFNGEPRLSRTRNWRGWASYQIQKFIDFIKTELTVGAVVYTAGHSVVVREYFIDMLSQQYVAEAADMGFVIGDGIIEQIRRYWPFGEGTESFDDLNNWLRDEMNLDMDRGVTTRGQFDNAEPSDIGEPFDPNSLLRN